jgi:hypothetical protein
MVNRLSRKQEIERGAFFITLWIEGDELCLVVELLERSKWFTIGVLQLPNARIDGRKGDALLP